jgi:hypothetical protein
VTYDDLLELDLGTTLGADQTAAIWDMCKWALYAGARAGTLPVAPLHLGRKLRWPTRPVLESVGIHLDELRRSGG